MLGVSHNDFKLSKWVSTVTLYSYVIYIRVKLVQVLVQVEVRSGTVS